GSELFKQQAQSGDVILKANNIEITNVEDLKRVINQSKDSIVLWVDGNPPAHSLHIDYTGIERKTRAKIIEMK
ncbi:hypothetical protein, partial [uncultured Sunxiuqinia sp.]|uniref:hypothetical protein n=1 Tax=uncultured Sunxiuqinia sp. TaxID=1573825 RepID=UPI0026312CB9